MATLSSMPELVMEKLLEELDFRSILTLRKVCHSFRNFIDDIQPDPHLTQLEIEPSQRFMFVYFYTEYKKIEVNYQDNISENGCYVVKGVWENVKHYFFKDEDFIDRFSKDLEVLFKVFGSKLYLKEFTLNYHSQFEQQFSKVSKVLENILKPYKIKAEKVIIYTADQDYVTSFLPYTDPESIVSFEWMEPSYHQKFHDDQQEIDKVIELEQWKRAKEIHIYRPIDPKEIKNMDSASKITFYIKNLRVEYFMSLKEMFLESSKLKEFIIKHADGSVTHEFISPLGPPSIKDKDETNWFTTNSKTGEKLKIRTYRYIMLSCIEIVKVESFPDNIIV